MLSLFERIGVKTWCKELLDVGLIELSNKEYACATLMPSNNNIFGNWTKSSMCGDYHLVNKITEFGRYQRLTFK